MFKMKREILVFYFIFAIIIIAVILLYFIYEKPKMDQIENSYIFLNIYATENNKNIVTGYKVMIDDILYSEGKTLKDAPISIEAYYNSSFTIFNENIDNQTYYSYVVTEKTDIEENKRINLILEPSYDLVINKTGIFNGDDIFLNISSKNFKGLRVCVKWSPHLIYANLFSNTSVISRIENPLNLTYYDKCFSTNYNLNSSNNYLLKLDYKYYDKITKDDYIKLVFFDTNCIKDNCSFTRKQEMIINNI